MTGIISSIGLAIFSKVFFNYFDAEFIFMIVFIITFGAWSIKTNNVLFFKLQPVATSLASVLFLLWCLYFSTPLHESILPALKTQLPPDQYDFLSSDIGLDLLKRMTLHIAAWTTIHAIFLAWTAVYKSTKFWLITKALNLPFIILMSLIFELLIK